TSGRIGAPIDAVPDAVMVGIDRTAVAIDLCAGRCCRAHVEQIVYAVAIRIPGAGRRRRTTFGVDRRAGRGVGTLIDPVEQLISLLIVLAAAQCNRYARRRFGSGTNPT